MIIRIMEEGQFRMADSQLATLNDLDNKIVDVVQKGDRTAYADVFRQLLEFVRKNGKPLPVEELHGSDVLIPRTETTFDEAQHLFIGEGIVPG